MNQVPHTEETAPIRSSLEIADDIDRQLGGLLTEIAFDLAHDPRETDVRLVRHLTRQRRGAA